MKNFSGRVCFFAHVNGVGVGDHFYNMVLSISRYIPIIVEYDEAVAGDKKVNKLRERRDLSLVSKSVLKEFVDKTCGELPIIFHCHGFSHLRTAISLARPLDKIMLTVHCFRNALWYKKVVSLLTYTMYTRNVDMWHFLSNENRNEYFWFRNVPSNTCCFPLGVEDIFMSNQFSTDDVQIGHINIVCIARFKKWKGHKFLLEALSPILKGDTYLYLVGDGPLKSEIEQFTKSLGIQKNVIFTGQISRENLKSLLRKASLAVTASRSETFGWCLLEPFCMDVPIVTTDVGIANSIVQDFRNGFVVGTKCSKEDFCKKVKLALKLFRQVDNSEVKNLYTWDKFGRNVAMCYESLLLDRT